MKHSSIGGPPARFSMLWIWIPGRLGQFYCPASMRAFISERLFPTSLSESAT